MKGWTEKNVLRNSTLTRRIGLQGKKKKNKYHAQTAEATDFFPELAGRSFHSRGERNRAAQLVLLQRAGEISELAFQVTVPLICGITWCVDFHYVDHELGQEVYEEFKGFETEAYRLKRKLWSGCGPARLRVTKSTPDGRTFLDREIIPDKTKLTNGRK